jgi:hypothetical protein
VDAGPSAFASLFDNRLSKPVRALTALDSGILQSCPQPGFLVPTAANSPIRVNTKAGIIEDQQLKSVRGQQINPKIIIQSALLAALKKTLALNSSRPRAGRALVCGCERTQRNELRRVSQTQTRHSRFLQWRSGRPWHGHRDRDAVRDHKMGRRPPQLYRS